MEQNLYCVVEEMNRKGVVLETEITEEMTTELQAGFQMDFCYYCGVEEVKRLVLKMPCSVSVDNSSGETVTAEDSSMNWKMCCFVEAAGCSCFRLLDVRGNGSRIWQIQMI